MMLKKILRRLAYLAAVLFGVTIMTFVYTNLSPVDAAYALAVRRYTRPTAEQVHKVRIELGMDKALPIQYKNWILNAIRGDFGKSYNTGQPIIEELSASIKPTLYMSFLALVFSIILTVPCAIISAARKGGLFDKSVYLFGIISMSIPNYWIGFIMMIVFAVHIPLFSIMGAESFKDFILPSLALAIPSAAGETRIFRSSLLEGYNSDFVLYARSRGVSEIKIAGMVSQFAIPPLITMLAQTFGFMIAGSAMIEFVFSIPGLGSMLVAALNARDTITINACVLFVAVIFVIVNFLADLINAIVNPLFASNGAYHA